MDLLRVEPGHHGRDGGVREDAPGAGALAGAGARLRAGERCVCDLTDDLEASQSRLCFHLKTLKDAGIVTDRRQGRWVYYALNPDTMEAMEAFVKALRSTSKLRVLAGGCD